MAKRKAGRQRVPHIVLRNGRYYADVRAFAAVLDEKKGEKSGRIALREKPDQLATTDPEIAQVLFTRLLADLRERSRTGISTGRWKTVKLGTYAAHHLVKKEQTGRHVRNWLTDVTNHLREAIAFFGKDTDIAAITTGRRPLRRAPGAARERPPRRGRQAGEAKAGVAAEVSQLPLEPLPPRDQ